MTNTLNLFCNGAVGFIEWLDLIGCIGRKVILLLPPPEAPVNRRADTAKRRCDSTNPAVRLMNETKPGLKYELCCACNEKHPTELPCDRIPAIHDVKGQRGDRRINEREQSPRMQATHEKSRSAISTRIDLTRNSSATAGGGELCFHFILHKSSFSFSVRRPAVGWSAWLGDLALNGESIIEIRVSSPARR